MKGIPGSPTIKVRLLLKRIELLLHVERAICVRRALMFEAGADVCRLFVSFFTPSSKASTTLERSQACFQ